ncbi:MAG TPA: hypothetical protein VID05_05775, partial [Acidimicrobiales bacterium]
APATESIMGSIPRAKAGIGSAMNDTTRQVGGALGVAVIGSVLASVYRPHVVENLSHTVLGKAAAGSGPTAQQAQQGVTAIRDQLGAAYAVAAKMPAGGEQVIHAARSAFVDGFGGAVLVGAVVALVGAIATFIFLPARAHDFEPAAFPDEVPALEAEAAAAAAAGSAHAHVDVMFAASPDEVGLAADGHPVTADHDPVRMLDEVPS